MTEFYICYSVKQTSWFSVNATGTSDWRQAKPLTKDEAIALCQRHQDHEGNLGMIPVPVSFLKEAFE